MAGGSSGKHRGPGKQGNIVLPSTGSQWGLSRLEGISHVPFAICHRHLHSDALP